VDGGDHGGGRADRSRFAREGEDEKVRRASSRWKSKFTVSIKTRFLEKFGFGGNVILEKFFNNIKSKLHSLTW